jgi:hypothetical protein
MYNKATSRKSSHEKVLTTVTTHTLVWPRFSCIATTSNFQRGRPSKKVLRQRIPCNCSRAVTHICLKVNGRLSFLFIRRNQTAVNGQKNGRVLCCYVPRSATSFLWLKACVPYTKSTELTHTGNGVSSIYVILKPNIPITLGLRGTTRQGSGEDYITRNLMTCTRHQILFG